MTRIALCISGHMRSFEQSFKTLHKSIIQPYNPDVFIYTPATIGNDGADRGDAHLIRSPMTSPKLLQFFAPKKYVIEPARHWDMSRYRGKVGSGCRNPSMIKGMYYGIHTANRLKCEYERERHMVYDVVIRCRADLFFENALDRAELESCQNGIYFPKFGSYGGLADQFAFGNSSMMDTYADTYEHIDDLFDMGSILHAETILKRSIEYSHIPILRSNIKYYILRANGTQFRLLCDPKQGDVL